MFDINSLFSDFVTGVNNVISDLAAHKAESEAKAVITLSGSDLSFANNSYSSVSVNNVDVDTHGFYDNSNFCIKIPESLDGSDFLISAGIRFVSSAHIRGVYLFIGTYDANMTPLGEYAGRAGFDANGENSRITAVPRSITGMIFNVPAGTRIKCVVSVTMADESDYGISASDLTFLAIKKI